MRKTRVGQRGRGRAKASVSNPPLSLILHYVMACKNISKFTLLAVALTWWCVWVVTSRSAVPFISSDPELTESSVLAPADAVLVRFLLSRHCGASAASALPTGGESPHALTLLRAISAACPPSSFLPFAGREVWPSAADAVVLSTDVASAAARSRVPTLLLDGCGARSARTARGACVLFLHQEALVAAAPHVLALLRANSSERVVLLTSSNDDYCVPWGLVERDGSWAPRPALEALLRHARMLAWFTENPCVLHSKLRPLPLGPKFRDTAGFAFGTGGDVRATRARLLDLAAAAAARVPPRRSHVLFASAVIVANSDGANFGLHCGVRRDAAPHVAQIALALAANSSSGGGGGGGNASGRIGWDAYARVLLSSSVIWAPPGRGIDSHRAWEAVLAGAVPLVLNSTLTPAYGGLRVLSVDDFASLTERDVTVAAAAAAAEPLRLNVMSPLFAFHWLALIDSVARGEPAARNDDVPFVIVGGVFNKSGRNCSNRTPPRDWPEERKNIIAVISAAAAALAAALFVSLWLMKRCGDGLLVRGAATLLAAPMLRLDVVGVARATCMP